MWNLYAACGQHCWTRVFLAVCRWQIELWLTWMANKYLSTHLGLSIWLSVVDAYQQLCKRDLVVWDRDKTETFDFQSETRPRPSTFFTRPRRDRDVRFRVRDWDLARTRSRPFPRLSRLGFWHVCIHRVFLVQLFWRQSMYSDHWFLKTCRPTTFRNYTTAIQQR